MKNPFNNSKVLQKKLELSEQKFRAITETATDAIIITDESSVIIYCNSKIHETFGYDKDELLGQNLEVIIPLKYREAHRKGVERFLSTGIPKVMGRPIELEGLHKSGHIFPIELSLSYWKENEEVYFTGILRDISERKKVENELIEREARLRLIAENTIDVILVNSIEGIILYISPSSESILGYKPEELIGLNVFDLYHPEDSALMKETYLRATTSDNITIVFRWRHKDGHYVWIESTGKAIRDSRGKPFQLHSVNRDITERKKSEEELIDNKHFIQRITDASPALISVFDLIANKSIYTNKELTEILGYSTDEVKSWGQDAMQMLIHPDDYLIIGNLYKNYANLKDGEICESELRVKHADGTYKCLYVRATVFRRNSEGKVWQILSTSLDVTDQKKAEAALKKAQKELEFLNQNLEEKVKDATEHLRQSENQLRLITQILPAFISYIDKDKIYRFVNDYYTKLAFISESPVGKSVPEAMGEEAYFISKKYMDKALAGESVKYENQFFLKNGEKVMVEVRYLPDKDEKGNVRGFIVMGVDLTERLNYEKELSRKNEALKKINNDLDNFIYTASHDLKAPISNIEGLTNEIKKNESYQKDNELQSLISFMEVSIQRFKNTIIDLTDITRVQKVMEGEAEEINLTEILDEIKFLLKDIIIETKAQIEYNLKVGSIRFSRKNLRSVLYNLLSNALKYRSPERSPKVEISTQDAGEYVEICVQDNGLGIPENRIEQVFAMFKRFHAHVEGTGVGLYIVKRIIDNAGGNIEVKSEVGKGTGFRVYIKK